MGAKLKTIQTDHDLTLILSFTHKGELIYDWSVASLFFTEEDKKAKDPSKGRDMRKRIVKVASVLKRVVDLPRTQQVLLGKYKNAAVQEMENLSRLLENDREVIKEKRIPSPYIGDLAKIESLRSGEASIDVSSYSSDRMLFLYNLLKKMEAEEGESLSGFIEKMHTNTLPHVNFSCTEKELGALVVSLRELCRGFSEKEVEELF